MLKGERPKLVAAVDKLLQEWAGDANDFEWVVLQAAYQGAYSSGRMVVA